MEHLSPNSQGNRGREGWEGRGERKGMRRRIGKNNRRGRERRNKENDKKGCEKWRKRGTRKEERMKEKG